MTMSTSKSSRSKALPLLCSRRFLPFFIVQFLGALNDNILKNVLVILITFRNVEVFGVPSSQMVALAGGIFILPFFLFSGLAGQMADKWSKAKLIRVIKLAEVGIMLVAAVGFYHSHYTWLLFALFLMGVHSAFFGPIKYSILPEALEPHELVGGNALVEAGTFIAILLGSVGGGLIAGGSGNIGFYASAILMVVALLGFVTSLAIPRKAGSANSIALQWDLLRPSISVMRVLRMDRQVARSVIAISWFWMLGAMVLSLLPPYVKDQWGGSERSVTLFLAAFSVGVGAGSMLCQKIARRMGYANVVRVGLVGMSICLGVVGLFPPSIPSIPFLAFCGFSLCGGLFAVPLYSLMQKKAPRELCSQVIAANNILNALFMVVGSLLLMGFLSVGLTPMNVFVVLGVVNALGMLLFRSEGLNDL